MEEIKYSNKVFAFLDILGFERIVNQSKSNPGLISRIANMLARSKRIAESILNAKLTVLQVNSKEYMYRAFSDTSVISGPYTSHDDMSFLSMWVMFYQYLMWNVERTFVRGAIVYGDIYHDQDVVFGPALIDAYHLETSKASWPRVLVNKSLLNKITETERARDFYEFLRQDDDSLVYLDYLREIFHLRLFAQSKKITGERERDLGSPTELFKDHKEAILMQVRNALKEENKDEGKKILKKYGELSKYHNSTIHKLCQIIKGLMTNTSIVRELFDDQLEAAKAKKSGSDYKPKYSAEEHPEQADMLNILGAVINNIITRQLENGSTALFGSTIWKQFELINGICLVPIQSLEILNNRIQEDAINSICQETPQELQIVDVALQASIVEIGKLSPNV
ncbi:hypothetical protein ES703_59261 [subsurface metagenome]